MPEVSLLCQKCGKPVDKSGSMTQWLFTKNKCVCTEETQLQEQRALKICPICGLRMRGREGSMTGWIFGSKACQCLDNEIIERQITTAGLPKQDLIGDEPFDWLGIAGEGGLGTVYKAKDLKLGRIVAVKVMQQDLEDPRAADTFMREARAASKLQHPNLVTISDFGMMKDGRYYLSLEWIDGITLAEYLERHGPLSVEAAVEIFGQILDGLSHAHNRDVIHRDIKPSNIMLGRTAFGGWMVKLIDFGTAKEERLDGFRTRAEDMVCSPFYVSPERVNGLFVDRRTDLYSLGCTLFEALTGRPPFRGEAVPVMMKHLNEAPPTLSEAANGKKFPESLEQIVAVLLAKNPDSRFATAEETRQALEDELIREGVYRLIDEQAVTTAGRSGKPSRSKALFFWILPVVVFSAGLFAWICFSSVQNEEQASSKKTELTYPTQTVTGKTGEALASTISGFGTKHVRIGGPTKADWLQLKKSKNAEKILVGDCVFMPNGAFADLACSSTIQQIEFSLCSKLNPKALEPLDNYPKLTQLRFADCILTPKFVSSIGQLRNVDFLEFKFCTFKPNAISGLSASSQLKLLLVAGCSLTDDDIASLQNPNLDVLDISDNKITGECLKRMNCKRSLQTLVMHHLQGPQFDFTGLKEYEKLNSIEFGGTTVSAKTLNEFAQIPKLGSLNLNRSPIDDDAYECFRRIPCLSNLALSETQTQDKDLEHLKNIPTLARVDLRDSKVTKEGFNEFNRYAKGKIDVVPPWYVKPGPDKKWIRF